MIRRKPNSKVTTLVRFLASRFNEAVSPDLQELYGPAAQQDARTRNPVIVIPGIMGTRLVDEPTNTSIWGGASKLDFADETVPEQARMIAHQMGDGLPLRSLTDDVIADGAIHELHASKFGLKVEIAAYGNIMRTLGVGGYEDTNNKRGRARLEYSGNVMATCLQFDYDWRRSIPENAVRFGAFVEAVARFAKNESECDGPAKIDVVAHSMGGLLLRYYLRYGGQLLPEDGSPPTLNWAGAKHIEHAMLVGPPNAGAAFALHRLVNGLPENAAMRGYDPVIVGSLPTLYQLMPRARHKAVRFASSGEEITGLFEVEQWERLNWGLASPEAEPMLRTLLPGAESEAARRRIALDHLHKCLLEASRFHDAIDKPVDMPRDINMHLFAGDGVSTAAVSVVDDDGSNFRDAEFAPGDGTVLRSSALMDERRSGEWSPRVVTPIRWDGVTFVPTSHMGLTRHPTFINNALYLLLEKPRPTCGYRTSVEDQRAATDPST